MIMRQILSLLALSAMLFLLCNCGPDDVPPPKTTCVTGCCDPVCPPEYTILDHTEWELSGSNPVFELNFEAGSWDEKVVSGENIIWFRDTLRMYYEGAAIENLETGMSIGYAWSLDGVTWKRWPDPVLEPLPGNWDYPHLASPRLLVDGDTLRMWYGSGDYLDRGMRIGLASSVDGINWIRHGDPVMTPNGTWNDGVLPGPVMKEDGLYKMWFLGGRGGLYYPTASAIWKTGYATSADGITWEMMSEPVLDTGTTFDYNSAVAGSVLKVGNLYEMWWTGGKKISSYTDSKIAFATSDDGITWEKYEGNPLIEISRGSRGLFFPSVVRHDSQLLMWYSAWHPGPSIHLASTDF